MTWYIKRHQINKFSAAKDKIRRFNIQDPILQTFTQQYENLVDWNQVSDEESIQDYIYDVLIPPVISKIERESEDNVYLKDIDLESEVEKAENDPNLRNHPEYNQIQQAIQYVKMDPEGSKWQIIEKVNEGKEEAFDEWWNYLSETNDIYKDNPAFMYMVMSAVVKSSPETSKTVPMTLNAEALASTWDHISQNKSPVNLMKLYSEMAMEVDKSNSQFTPTQEGNGWLYIPGKQEDPGNFEENVKKLIRLSCGSNWCTGAGAAPIYLQKGNFWVFVEGGRAKAIIRTIAEGQERAAEIQGPGNSIPIGYVDQIFQIIESRPDIQWDGAINYQKLKESRENTQDPPVGSVDFEPKLDQEDEEQQPKIARSKSLKKFS